MINGLDYYPMQDEELINLREHSQRKAKEFNAEPDAQKRVEILKSFLGKMGEGILLRIFSLITDVIQN